MAAGGSDGSLKFDTKVNTEGFDAGMSTLTKAVERLSGLVENITKRMEGSFTGAGSASADAAKKVGEVGDAATDTSKKVDSVADSAKRAREEMEKMAAEKASIFSGTIEFNDGGSQEPEKPGRYDIYGRDVDAIIQKNKELETAARETANTMAEESEKENQSIVGLKDSMIFAFEAFKKLPMGIKSAFQVAGNAADGTKKKARNLQDEIDRYADALHYAERAGKGLGDKDYDAAYVGLARAKKKAEEYKKSLLNVDGNQKKVAKSSRKMGDSLRHTTSKATIPLTKSILKLSSMFKLMVIRMAMRGAIQAAKEGFQNLAQYSDETNKSISMLMSANTRLKNSFATAFAPILNVAAPALKSLIDLLSEAVSWSGQLWASLSGKSTFVKAVDVEEDYGAALKESNKQLKEKEKANKKLTFSFDNLIKAQESSKADGYIGPTPDQMFETVEVEKDIKDFADKVQGIFADLFTPLKQSWADNGPSVTEAAKAAFESLKALAGDVGSSFMQVWKTEGYGKKITDDLLITFTNLALTVKNLADRFDDAWNSGDTGTSILRHLGDIILEITGFFRDASESIKDWAAKLDFSPLLRSFDNVLAKLTPIVGKVGDALLWLLNNVFLPLGKWALEKAVPKVLDLISAALSALNSVLGALKPLAMWLWDSFLQPLGKWTGKIIIDALDKLVGWLTKFSDWVNQNQGAVENIAIVIAAFFAAWKFATFITGVVTMIAKIKLLSQILGLFGIDLLQIIAKIALAGLKFGALTLAITGIISVIAILARNWGSMSPSEKVISTILAAAAAVGMLAVALGAIKGAAGAAVVAGALVAGIMAATIAINAGKRQSESYQASSGYSARSVQGASYNMPRLATGTVVPPRAGEFAAILGDNNRDTEIVSPVPAMKQAFKEAIEEMGGLGGNRPVRGDVYLDRQKFGKIVYSLNKDETQRIGTRLITEG